MDHQTLGKASAGDFRGGVAFLMIDSIIMEQVLMRPYPNHRYRAPQQVRMLDGLIPRISFFVNSQTSSKVPQSTCIAPEECRSGELATIEIRDKAKRAIATEIEQANIAFP